MASDPDDWAQRCGEPDPAAVMLVLVAMIAFGFVAGFVTAWCVL